MTPDTDKAGAMEVPQEIRESYIQAIASIDPFDEIESKDIAETLQWLRTAASVNKPQNAEEHLGVFAVVLSPDLQHTFLLHHRKAGLWLPPGGHVDAGLTFQEAAMQEVREELSMHTPNLIADNPVFLTRTLTQGLNAGHIDVTVWLLVEGNRRHAYHVQEKEAADSGWQEIDQLLRSTAFANLHRGFQKMKNTGMLGKINRSR